MQVFRDFCMRHRPDKPHPFGNAAFAREALKRKVIGSYPDNNESYMLRKKRKRFDDDINSIFSYEAGCRNEKYVAHPFAEVIPHFCDNRRHFLTREALDIDAVWNDFETAHKAAPARPTSEEC